MPKTHKIRYCAFTSKYGAVDVRCGALQSRDYPANRPVLLVLRERAMQTSPTAQWQIMNPGCTQLMHGSVEVHVSDRGN